MKPVSDGIAMWGWLSSISRSMVDPDRMEPTMNSGADGPVTADHPPRRVRLVVRPGTSVPVRTAR